jgi:hypothetical protein
MPHAFFLLETKIEECCSAGQMRTSVPTRFVAAVRGLTSEVRRATSGRRWLRESGVEEGQELHKRLRRGGHNVTARELLFR